MMLDLGGKYLKTRTKATLALVQRRNSDGGSAIKASSRLRPNGQTQSDQGLSSCDA